ncbi:MAG: substrate-binding domain-containing protein [Burkholderiaceae bacterium]|nr:substrate-binding domain-containing protein [Burkholderiaceae bacterium]
MHEVTIRPQWTIRSPEGGALAPRVVELLVQLHEHGSLSAACKASGASYRHAWDLIRQGEQLFGQPLVQMVRGQGSTLTALGEKLVWADRRIHARLSPLLDTLASELGAEIQKLLSPQPTLLRIRASHGFAIEVLHHMLLAGGVANELKYCGSLEALSSLSDAGSELAGFHVPEGEFEAPAVAHYAAWLKPRSQKLIHVATRRQGLMVAPGNPKRIYGVSDLTRAGVRFINRQPGSGTRFLFDLLLRQHAIASSEIHGYEQCEYTHAAVAAFVASGMADAGYGVETPARQFKLDFIPGHSERYFLLCDERSFNTPAVEQTVALLCSDAFKDAVNQLPGYRAERSGEVVEIDDAFETLRLTPARQKQTRR